MSSLGSVLNLIISFNLVSDPLQPSVLLLHKEDVCICILRKKLLFSFGAGLARLSYVKCKDYIGPKIPIGTLLGLVTTNSLNSSWR